MKDQYFNYYILSYFNTEKVVSLSQVLHVLRGKKTPSMYYLTQINQWHHGFSLEKRIEKDDLRVIIRSALDNQLLISKEQGFLLTDKGSENLNQYFKNHYYPKEITNFKNIDLYLPFWDRLQLFTQVFSEYSYKNVNYIAVIKNPHHQEKVRQLFQAVQGKMDKTLLQWMKEQEFIFENLEEEKANILANFLTGHNKVGKTRKQLANELKMLEYEFKFYLRDILSEVIKIIRNNAHELALMFDILNQTMNEYFISLSESTYRTYQMLEQGNHLKKIASVRRIKENTVKEHILEIAFVLEVFPTEKFIPEEIYVYLHEQFNKNIDYSYKEALLSNQELEFYHYRLVELERMRMN